MMYYRVAWKSSSGAIWQWKSTKLSSIDALLRFIEMYSAMAPGRLHIFSSSSAKGLNELLERKNGGFETDSLSVEEFLLQQGMTAPGNSKGQEDEKEEPIKRFIAVTHTFPRGILGGAERVLDHHSVDNLQSRRSRIEQGEGGDHDIPYTFTLPVSLPQILAWTRLLAKVQHGELES
jgi:hypothetical protein